MIPCNGFIEEVLSVDADIVGYSNTLKIYMLHNYPEAH